MIKRNEIQQLEYIASETKQALVHSRDLQDRYLEQKEELAEFQKRQAVDNLVAGFSHNMGNFLQPIISLAALLKKQESDTEKKQFISIIYDSASKAQDTSSGNSFRSRANARRLPFGLAAEWRFRLVCPT